MKNQDYIKELERKVNERIKGMNEDDIRTYLSLFVHCGYNIEATDRFYNQLQEKGILLLSEVQGYTTNENLKFGWVTFDK